MAALQRVRTSAQFDAALRGRIVARTPHFALHALQWRADAAPVAGNLVQRPLFGAEACHLGVLVPKRWARRAVTRNLVKRQIRAVAAAHAAQLPVRTAIVVRLRAEFDRQTFVSASSVALRQAVRTELQQLFGRLCQGAPAANGTAAQPCTSGTMRGAS